MTRLDLGPNIVLDIELYLDYGGNYWAQAKYLVHCIDDVLWTNDIDVALNCLREELERAEEEGE